MNLNSSLITIALASPVTVNFKACTTGVKYQRPPLVLSALNFNVLDDGTNVSAVFRFQDRILPLILWGPKTNPTYASTPPGTGAGEIWTNVTVRARMQDLMGSDQVAFIKSLFPADQLA